MKKADNRRKLAQFPKNSIYVSPLAHRKTPIEQLSRSAKQQIAKLVELTNQGAHDGPAELYSTAVLATVWLTWLCKKKPELFMGIARNKFYWPLMCNLHPGDTRKNAELLEKLTLGADTQINLSGKTFSWDVPANRVALDLHKLARMLQRTPMKSWALHDLITLRGVGRSSDGTFIYDEKYEKQLRALEEWGQRGAGKDLPPLNKETAAQWAKATVDLFRICYGKNFEEHPDLQELKASVSRRAKDAFGKTGARGTVRKAMLQTVKQAWHSIAAWTK